VLAHIHVHNFTIADEVDVEFPAGMTALTGETGAGKSILVDALGLVLGDRADSGVIRHGCGRAEISAGFDISGLPAVTAWLENNTLDADGECQLRRTISREGRSRGFINGQPVPMQSMRQLGEQLVDIHGQHEHQSLLKGAMQRQLLDSFGGHEQDLSRIAALFDDWKKVKKELEAATCIAENRDAQLDLLRYQSQELDSLGLSEDEIGSLDEEHSRLANAGRLLDASQRALARLYDDEQGSAYQLVSQSLNDLGELLTHDSGLEAANRLLNDTLVTLQEGVDELRHYAERLELDPERLQWVDERLGVLHELSRKHRCTPEQLPAVQEMLRSELDALEHADQHREELAEKLAGLGAAYQEASGKLSHMRSKAARTFSSQITAAMQSLGMPGGVFEVSVQPVRDGGFGPHGLDSIEFMVSTNPGQPARSLAKVVSGGELSRISLAIQVTAARDASIPTLIFDEVDSGIGGGVAEIVGQLLHTLGKNRQVLCVTHLPQVAALADHQLQVTKLSGKNSTRTRIRNLGEEERIDELARMLGGIKITKQTREHAREMMMQSQSA